MACGVPLVTTTGGALPEVVGPHGESAMTVPVASGVAVHDAGTVLLNGKGEITHVVNDTGSAATKPGALNPVTAYP